MCYDIQAKSRPARNRPQTLRKQPKPDVRKIIFNLPWETYRDDLICISRDELARLAIQSLEAEKFSKRTGPMRCQCCCKTYKGAYELKRHYGTHLLKKIVSCTCFCDVTCRSALMSACDWQFKCGNKTCGFVSAQKDNCRTHCRKLRQ